MTDPLDCVPTADEFRSAFIALEPMPLGYRHLLLCHYRAPNRDVTATRLAQLAGFANHNAANLHYGILARLVGDQLDLHPAMRLDLLVTMEKRGQWHWYMRPQVAQALGQLGWTFDI